MSLWLLFSIFFILILIFLCHRLRQKEKEYKNVIIGHRTHLNAIESESRENNSELQEKDSELQEKDSENQHLKEKLLKITSGK